MQYVENKLFCKACPQTRSYIAVLYRDNDLEKKEIQMKMVDPLRDEPNGPDGGTY